MGGQSILAFGKRIAVQEDGLPPTNRGGEKRRAKRKPTVEKAALAYGYGTVFVDVTVVDISRTGARVLVRYDPDIPQRIFLVQLDQKIAREARIAWVRPDCMGLEFIRSHDLTNPTSPELEAIASRCR